MKSSKNRRGTSAFRGKPRCREAGREAALECGNYDTVKSKRASLEKRSCRSPPFEVPGQRRSQAPSEERRRGRWRSDPARGWNAFPHQKPAPGRAQSLGTQKRHPRLTTRVFAAVSLPGGTDRRGVRILFFSGRPARAPGCARAAPASLPAIKAGIEKFADSLGMVRWA